MGFRTVAAVLVCRVSAFCLRRLGRGGTNLPGRLALMVDPGILGRLAKGVRVTLVTGTNGKTTVCGMIGRIFEEAGISYVSNRQGANLLSGIVVAFGRSCRLSGSCRHTRAVIECDEASLPRVTRYLKVDCLVVTNLFRDQLDRYGELDQVRDLILEGVSRIPEAVLCLNTDDSITSSLAAQVSNQVIWFGIEPHQETEELRELSDAPCCIRCGAKYQYSYRTYGHLGGFFCPVCGYSRREPEVTAEEHPDDSWMLRLFGAEFRLRSMLPGIYNLYNAASAAAAALQAGIRERRIVLGLEQARCGFGRGAWIDLDGARACVLLVKNPSGLNQAVRRILRWTDGGRHCRLAFLLNDKAADGRDVSWIWDADLEALAARQQLFTELLVSGRRADDMALRLKYAGFEESRIHRTKDSRALLRRAGRRGGEVFLTATYTAMQELQKRLGCDMAVDYLSR